ncbi:sulfite reductase subunit alpha [Paraglaciecola hydrolytica]|uniref:NADPH--hemoprotein reductase n=1 Tax=Paraglaciecola hydrolytica TaxID=1799789 RepID=A0A148KN25_9ALTE|nr:sulfite reductase subunit alpha [Paraglaciecola hydrolytica]KXI27712.1 hypothetical protein AX660_19360 [Paraglaciecola hydrolytica]
MSDLERFCLIALVLLSYGLLCTYCIWRNRSSLQALGVKGKVSLTDIAAKPSFLVAYASQTGTAAALAQRSGALFDGQLDYQILPLNKVDNEVLSYTTHALFVVSTYGEGEPPDNGMAFAARYLQGSTGIDLSHLQFSVLALGDKLYQQFCAFGHNLHQGMSQLGAIPLFEPLEACASAGFDSEGLIQEWAQHWRQGVKSPQSTVPVSTLISKPLEQKIAKEEFSNWRLVSRSHLNPGSPGAPVFHVCLAQTTAQPLTWQAGDLIEVAFESSFYQELNTAVKRKYSIASMPQDGVVELIVRQHINDDGSFGIGSGCLTAKAPLNTELSLRLCDNPLFHGIEPERPMILIGSGTGLAGLRAHIKQREQQGARANWLLFGERSPEHDSLFNNEINTWQQSGVLSRVDLAFSRDPDSPAYVQDLLFKYAAELRGWIDDGAAIFVCGNRLGMAHGVDQALQQILDADSYQGLLSFAHYRRDIY